MIANPPPERPEPAPGAFARLARWMTELLAELGLIRPRSERPGRHRS